MADLIIKTDYSLKPIPDRSHDWCATLTIFNGDDHQPVGWGASESEAVTDLLQECMCFDDGGAQDMLIELAHRGWCIESKEAKE